MEKKVSFIEESLNKRKEKGLIRRLRNDSNGIDFSSNDYLSLNTEHRWISYLKKEIPEKYWFQSLSSSRLVSGNSNKKEEVEEFFASFYESEKALFFSSGYTANLSIFSSMMGKDETVLYDSDIHASIRDGLQMSHAKSYKFKHNSPESLEKRLKSCKGQIYVVVESVYSMDGQIAPLKEILEVCEKYGAFLIVDEAHSTGLFGLQGRGLCHELGISDRVFIRVMTFGKAVACHGAVVLSSTLVRDFLINFARPFIYTTAPSTFDFLKAQKSVECIAKNEFWMDELRSNIQFFNNLLGSSNGNNQVPIIPFYNDSISKLKSFETLGLDHQFRFKSILSPTVAKGSECIRFSIQRSMSQEDLLKVGNLLKSHFELL